MNITKSSTTRKVILLMIVLVVGLTILTAFIAFTYFRNQKITSLSQRVNSFALALNINQIQSLTASDADLNNPAYDELKHKVMSLQNYNADTRFIYLMGLHGGEIFFYTDSENPISEDYSPPGQIYDEASETMHSVFTDNKIATEVSSDRWGTWLSVMAPVSDPATKKVIALVGFDMPYQSFLTEVILFTMLPVSIGIIIIILLIAAFVYAKKDENLMKMRSEYFAIAAHDLRTPLTGIKWAMASLIKSKPISENTTYSGIVSQISQSTDNMLSSVNELLDGSSVGKIGETKLLFAPVNITDMLPATFTPLEISAKEKKLTVNMLVNKNLVINGDTDKLRRVFANVVSNAIKYSKEGGSVKIGAKKINNEVVVSVKDSGIGIPPNEQEKVFSGYFRASNAKEHTTQGTGLGLYYVKNIVQLH